MFSYMLWFVVLIRFLCPISIELPVSMIPQKVDNGAFMKEMLGAYVGAREIYEKGSEEFNTAIGSGLEPIIVLDKDENLKEAYVTAASDGVSEPKTRYEALMPVLSNIWVLGMMVFGCYSIVSFIKLRKKIVGSVSYDEEDEIFFSDYVDTAFVIGILYPRIYLPSSIEKEELRYILQHEKYHIRRKDHIVKVLAFIALCIHWFNPFAWSFFILFHKDMEMSCDEAVLRKMGDEIRQDYSASLLKFATPNSGVVTAPLAFGEGNTKERIKNVIAWKAPTKKIIVFTAILCSLTGMICFASPKNDTMDSVYEWTSNLSEEMVDKCTVISWDDTMEYKVSEKQLADFIYVLNEISPPSITQEKSNALKEITVIFHCGKQKFFMTYGNGITMFSFDEETKWLFDETVWQTDDKNLAKSMRRLLSQGTRVPGTEVEEYVPSKEEVLAMREKVLKGMSEEEVKRFTELVQVENQNREYGYLENNKFWNYRDPESSYWKLYTESGRVQLGWGIPCDAPGFDPEGELTEEEYYEMYGTPFVEYVEVPYAEKFYNRLTEFRSLVKTDLLDADFDTLEKYMELAVETHDVNYLYQIYFMLHDMDYFLLRYGPEDVGKYTYDDSTVSKYYGVLHIYENMLPSN